MFYLKRREVLANVGGLQLVSELRCSSQKLTNISRRACFIDSTPGERRLTKRSREVSVTQFWLFKWLLPDSLTSESAAVKTPWGS